MMQIQTEVRRHFQLLPENFRLPRLVSLEIRLRPRRLRPTMIIQTRLADGHDLGMPRQRAQSRPHIGRRVQHVRRMPADGGIDMGIFLGDLNCARAAFQVGADGDDFGDALRPRAPGR